MLGDHMCIMLFVRHIVSSVGTERATARVWASFRRREKERGREKIEQSEVCLGRT